MDPSIAFCDLIYVGEINYTSEQVYLYYPGVKGALFNFKLVLNWSILVTLWRETFRKPLKGV